MNSSEKIHLENSWHNPDWKSPEIIYGENLIAQATDTDERYVVITMEIPWNLVKDKVVKQPEKVIFVANMHIESLMAIEAEVPQGIEMVIGIGGGSTHDTAKYVALKRNIRLLQMPTIFGGDSVVCNAIGIREDMRVKYIAHARAEKVYVDFAILRKAPEKLVRYGAADILSSYTALYDWKLASERDKEKYDADAANFAKNILLKRLASKSEEIRNITNDGIMAIVDLFIEYARLANKIDTDRAQEGSEHFFAYNAEYTTGRTYVHGALLSLGIWVSGGFYHDRLPEVTDFLDALGLEYNLDSAGLSADEFSKTILSLDSFTREGGYYYSVVNEKAIDRKFVDMILSRMK